MYKNPKTGSLEKPWGGEINEHDGKRSTERLNRQGSLPKSVPSDAPSRPRQLSSTTHSQSSWNRLFPQPKDITPSNNNEEESILLKQNQPYSSSSNSQYRSTAREASDGYTSLVSPQRPRGTAFSENIRHFSTIDQLERAAYLSTRSSETTIAPTFRGDSGGSGSGMTTGRMEDTHAVQMGNTNRYYPHDSYHEYAQDDTFLAEELERELLQKQQELMYSQRQLLEEQQK